MIYGRARFVILGQAIGNFSIAWKKLDWYKKRVGYETSKSRYNFTEKFETHINAGSEHHINNDFLKGNPLQAFDLMRGGDIVF